MDIKAGDQEKGHDASRTVATVHPRLMVIPIPTKDCPGSGERLLKKALMIANAGGRDPFKRWLNGLTHLDFDALCRSAVKAGNLDQHTQNWTAEHQALWDQLLSASRQPAAVIDLCAATSTKET